MTEEQNVTFEEIERRVGRLFVPAHRRGASVFRGLVGALALYQLLVNYGQRHILYGPGAISPWDTFADGFGFLHYSLFALSSNPNYFETIYHLSIFWVMLWTLGWWTKIGTPLVWLVMHSLGAREPGLRDGGDNLITILLIYASFMDLSPVGKPKALADRGFWGLLHNSALVACMIQVCTVYFVAGSAKLDGAYWTNGTAFYYVLRSREFGVTSLGSLFWNSPLLLSLCTWGPVMLQLAFPWIYLFGRAPARRVVICLAISFHLGIALFMGLASFAGFMIAAELLLLSDEDYAWFANQLHRLRCCWRRAGASLSTAALRRSS